MSEASRGHVRCALCLLSLLYAVFPGRSAAATDLTEALATLEARAPEQTLCAAVLADSPDDGEAGNRMCRRAGVTAYLSTLRARMQADLAERLVAARRDLLDLVRQAVNAGALSHGDLLLAEVALKSAQRRQAAADSAFALAALDYRLLFGAVPKQQVLPGHLAESLPGEEAAALARLPVEASPALRRTVRRAWITLEAGRREQELLEPAAAFAEDLARAYRQRFEIGQIGLRSLIAAFDQRDRLAMELIAARHARVAGEIELLRLLESAERFSGPPAQ